jgi:serpin B
VALLALAPPRHANPEETVTTSSDADAVAHGNNAFAVELFMHLASQEKGNLFLSPYSVSTALAMTYAGARGETASQMGKVLHFGLPPERLHQGFSALSAALRGTGEDRKGYRLIVANRLWGQRDYGFLADFLRTTRDLYGAELAQVDFAQQPEAARLEINAWVEKETARLIKDLLPPGVPDPLARLVLTNAIYFKGDWTSRFDPQATRDAPFHLMSEDAVDIPMMSQKDDFRYNSVNGIQILELPYADKELSMIVVLPPRTSGLRDLEAELTSQQIDEWTSDMVEREVDVRIPKFEMSSRLRLNGVLAALGMTQAFDRAAADFSGMNGRGRRHRRGDAADECRSSAGDL